MDNGPATATQNTPLHLIPLETLIAEMQRRGWVLSERTRNGKRKPILIGPGRRAK